MSNLTINFLLPRANMSGGVKSNRLIAEALARRGHDVVMYHPVVSPRKFSWKQPRKMIRHACQRWRNRGRQSHHLERARVPVIPVNTSGIGADLVRNADWNVATWWETMEWLDEWPASKGRKAYFVRAHEVYNGPVERVQATYRMRGQKLVISRWLQRLMAEEYDDPHAVLVPNGVDWGSFDSETRAKSSTPTVGMMYGREPWKGAETAFAALRQVQAAVPNVRLIGFGSKELLRTHHPPRGFEFHLRPPVKNIAALYRQADCWLLASTTEGFGMPGLEAAACRCPLVCTQCGGPEDYVSEGRNGFLVPVGAANQLAARILHILRLPNEQWLQMSEASYGIASQFSWDSSAARLESTLAGSTHAQAA